MFLWGMEYSTPQHIRLGTSTEPGVVYIMSQYLSSANVLARIAVGLSL